MEGESNRHFTFVFKILGIRFYYFCDNKKNHWTEHGWFKGSSMEPNLYVSGPCLYCEYLGLTWELKSLNLGNRKECQDYFACLQRG